MARKLTAAQLRKIAVTIRATVDQGEFAPDEEHTLLDQVIDDDELLADLEDQYPLLFNALIRCEEDYAAQVLATQHTECSLDAVDAITALVAKGAMPADEPDAEPEADESDTDPDADLDPERN